MLTFPAAARALRASNRMRDIVMMSMAGLLICGGRLPAQDLIVTGGSYFDVTTLSFRSNPGIVIRDGDFVRFGVNEVPPGENDLKLRSDHFILPGLIDLHAHYNVRLFDRRREEFLVMPAVYLANGATVTFSAGEYDPIGMQQLRLDIEQGNKIGPRLINSGPYFGRARRSWNRDATPDEIRREVSEWAPRVGGFKAKQIGPKHLSVLIEAAHKHGLTVTGHLDSGYRGSVNPLDAIQMGIDRVEHFLGGASVPDTQSAYATLATIRPDDPELAKVIPHYVNNGVYFDATITAYGYFGKRGEEYQRWMDESQFLTEFARKELANKQRRQVDMFQKIYELKQKTIKRYFEAGGLITLGTDHVSDGDFLPGFGIHRELDAFVRSGIPPANALAIATLNGASALGIADRHGSITPDKSGDLYIIKGDPLADIRNTRNGVYVVRAGKLYVPSEVFKEYAGRLGPVNADEKASW